MCGVYVHGVVCVHGGVCVCVCVHGGVCVCVWLFNVKLFWLILEFKIPFEHH